MAKKRLTKLVDDQDKFFAWLKKCPYTFKYRYEMGGTIILTFTEADPWWDEDKEREDVGMD